MKELKGICKSCLGCNLLENFGFKERKECKYYIHDGKEREINIRGITIIYDAGNIRIVDSYRVKYECEMVLILRLFQMKTHYQSKRSLKSWIKEWKAHNRLYRLGLFRKHTKDCDLEENEKKYRLLIYQILGV